MRETRSRADRILANAQEVQGISSSAESANSTNDTLEEERDVTKGMHGNEVEEIRVVHGSQIQELFLKIRNNVKCYNCKAKGELKLHGSSSSGDRIAAFWKVCDSHTQGRVGTLEIEMAEMATSRNSPTAPNHDV